MIHLYKNGNENYEMNGDIILSPTSCELDLTLNGEWIGTLKHPLDENGYWKELQNDVVLKVPSPNGKDQLYQVVDYEVDDNKGITAYLEHIFMNAVDDCWIDDVRPTNKNGDEALKSIITNPKYSGSSDISKVSTAYYLDKNLLDAINGNDENSFINRWGGEIYFDNFHVYINEQIGSDKNVEIRYGKNVQGMNINTDYRDVVTCIKPKAYNGYAMSNDSDVRSSMLDKYRTMKKRMMTFDDVKMRVDAQAEDEEKGIIICDTQEELDKALIKRCEEQFESGLDKPAVTGEISLYLLQNTEEYKDVQKLERVDLGDTVHCYNSRLDVISDARVVHLKFNCLAEKVTYVEIGQLAFNYFDRVNSTVAAAEKVIDIKTNTLIAEKVRGIISATNAYLRAQRDVAQKQDYIAFLIEDLNPESPTFGAMLGGTQGLQLARERTPDGSDWNWGTAITFESVIADYIITGILTDKQGNFYLNMDEGTLVLKNAYFSGTVQGSEIVGGTISGSNIEGGNIRVYTDLNVGNFIFLDNNNPNGSSVASGIKLGNMEVSSPLINMWGYADQNKGYILVKPLSADDKCQVFMSNDNGARWISIDTGELYINGMRGITYEGSVRSLKTEKGIVVGVNNG